MSFPATESSYSTFPTSWDNKLFQDRSDLFSQPVRCTLYEGGRRRVLVEQDFRELQIF